MITGLRKVVTLDSDKWYLFHILFNIVNYIIIKKIKRVDTELLLNLSPQELGEHLGLWIHRWVQNLLITLL